MEIDEGITYDSCTQGVVVTVGMVYRDEEGRRIPPFMGVKMGDSDWYPVKRINEMALEFAERKILEEAE